MGIAKIGERYYVSFKWRGHRIRTVTSATNRTQANRILRAVRTAFRIGRFDHLEPDEQEVVTRTHQNKGWPLPLDLRPRPSPEAMTLIKAIKEYLRRDKKHRSKRNIYAINRLVEYFGEGISVTEIKAKQVREYQTARSDKVENGTVNREMAVLSGIMQVQVEDEIIDYNPCRSVRRLPANQRDSYLSWDDFNTLLANPWWIRDLLLILYYTGMRLNEVFALNWDMYHRNRRMLILPPTLTKEGKNPRKLTLRSKRVPLRMELVGMLEARRRGKGSNVIKVKGPIFTYEGRFQSNERIPQGSRLVYSTIRKAWARTKRLAYGATGKAEFKALQIRDFRHTWKTNAQRSGMDPAVRNTIVGHSTERSVEDRYIRICDEVLLQAVDEMTFDNGCTELDCAIQQ